MNYNLSAFIIVVLIWGATPFFISQSSVSATPLFAIFVRMLIAAAICFIILKFLKQQLNFKQFWRKYFYAGLGISVTLSLVYISVLNTPSGLVSVIFALSPVATGIFASIIGVDTFSKKQIIVSIIVFIGTAIIFFDNQLAEVFYLFLLLVAMIFQTYISVKIKQLNIKATSFQTTTGALLFSLPFLFISFLLFEGSIPEIKTQFVIATMFLATFGSIFGFIGYYYLIDNAKIFLVGLVPVLTPVLALFIGVYFNNEIITKIDYLGSIIVLVSVIYYQLYGKES